MGPPLGSPGAHLVELELVDLERRLVGRRTKNPQRQTTARVPTGMAKVRAWVPARSAIMTDTLPLAQMTTQMT